MLGDSLRPPSPATSGSPRRWLTSPRSWSSTDDEVRDAEELTAQLRTALESRRVAALADRSGPRVLDAPVLGTRQPAEQGALVVLASGDPALRPGVEPAFDAMGSRTLWAGDSLGSGSALRLACNAWVATVTAGVAQSLSLAGAQHLDPRLFLDAIAGGQSDTPYAHLKGETMLSGEFPAQFALDGVVKDLGLIRTAIGDSGIDTVLVGALLDTFQCASEAGHGGEDIAAVVTAFRPAVG